MHTLETRLEAPHFVAEQLGSMQFKYRYGVRYAYLAGGMYKAIASKALVERMAYARLLSFLGTAGCALPEIENDVSYLKNKLGKEYPFGVNLIHHLHGPEVERSIVDICLRHSISTVEAAAFMDVTPALVYYRLSGLYRDKQGNLIIPNRIIAKVSHPQVARIFLSPPPEAIVNDLLAQSLITQEQAKLSEKISMCSDICVEADSGGHTDQGVSIVLIPAIARLRDTLQSHYQYSEHIHVGAAGGLGTPEAIAAAFIMGADFITTGSINQCTVEAGTSERVKSILQSLDIQDTVIAPTGDMFEIGAKARVVRKGILFPARANKLYQLYQQYGCLEDIDENTRRRIENQYFKRSFDEVLTDVKNYLSKKRPEELQEILQNPRKKMVRVFQWYFFHTGKLAREGISDETCDYQIHCGPAMGAFNQWVEGSDIEDWRNRHVDDIANRLMQNTAAVMNRHFKNAQRLTEMF